MSKRVELPFTNEFGHKINPGDPVIAVTVCTGRTSIRRATYLGYVPVDVYNRETNTYEPTGKRVQIRAPAEKFGPVYIDTGEVAKWPYDPARPRNYKSWTVDRVSTLCYNNILPDTASVDELITAV